MGDACELPCLDLAHAGRIRTALPDHAQLEPAAGLARGSASRPDCGAYARRRTRIPQRAPAGLRGLRRYRADVSPADGVTVIRGFGVTGTVDVVPLRLGRSGWIDGGRLDAEVTRLRAAGATAVLVERDSTLFDEFAGRDELHPEAPDVAHLRTPRPRRRRAHRRQPPHHRHTRQGHPHPGHR